jgi:exonuclease SbcD
MGCDFSFVHCADLHLGSRFYAVTQSSPDLGGRLYEAVFSSFRRIVDLAKERADFMVIAGDIYDDVCETPRTRLFFASEMERLGKPCFVVRGNHDFTSSWDSSIAYPPNVYVLGPEGGRKRMTIRGHTVEVVGASYSEQHEKRNIAASLRGTPGVFTIGVAHVSVDGLAEDYQYAPCALSDLLGKDVDYWALGHIHKRQVLRTSSPMVVYPGNIQGRSPRETGEKGCYLVSVAAGAPSAEFVPTQEIVWKDVTADITGKTDLNQLLDSIIPQCPRGGIACLHFTGRGTLSKAVRADPEGIAKTVSERAGCSADIREISVRPDIDLENPVPGTLTAEAVRSEKELESMTDEELMELLCGSGPATDVSGRMRYFAEKGELKRMLREALAELADRLEARP